MNAEGAGNDGIDRPLHRHDGFGERGVRPADPGRGRAERRGRRPSDGRDVGPARRPLARHGVGGGHADRPGVGLSDPRERGRALRALHRGDHQHGSGRRSTSTSPNAPRSCQPDIAHLVTDDARERGDVRHRRRRPTSTTGRWPARPARPTATRTSGSWATRAQVVTAVWVGSPGTSYSMGNVFGGTVSAPIWHNYMEKVMQGLPVEQFPYAPMPSLSPPAGNVPNVVGMDQAAATQALTTAGLPGVRATGPVEPGAGDRGGAVARGRLAGLGGRHGDPARSATDRHPPTACPTSWG